MHFHVHMNGVPDRGQWLTGQLGIWDRYSSVD